MLASVSRNCFQLERGDVRPGSQCKRNNTRASSYWGSVLLWHLFFAMPLLLFLLTLLLIQWLLSNSQPLSHLFPHSGSLCRLLAFSSSFSSLSFSSSLSVVDNPDCKVGIWETPRRQLRHTAGYVHAYGPRVARFVGLGCGGRSTPNVGSNTLHRLGAQLEWKMKEEPQSHEHPPSVS